MTADRLPRRLTRFLLHRFPERWRNRYGDEMTALVDQVPVGWATVVDVGVAWGNEWAHAIRRSPETPREVTRRNVVRLALDAAGSVVLAVLAWWAGTWIAPGVANSAAASWIGPAWSLMSLIALARAALAYLAFMLASSGTALVQPRLVQRLAWSNRELGFWVAVWFLILVGHRLEGRDSSFWWFWLGAAAWMVWGLDGTRAAVSDAALLAEWRQRAAEGVERG